MNRDRSADRLLVGLATVVLVVAGCAGGSAAGTPTVPTASATAVPTPATSASATSSRAGTSDRVTFTGTATFALPEGLDETTDGPFTTYVGKAQVTYATSDPRVSGSATGVLSMVSADLPDGYTVNKWFNSGDCDDFVITNAGGAWRCAETFGADMWDPTGGIHTVYTDAYLGEGGYDGLRVRLFGAQGTSEPADATAEFIVYGWIEPAD